MLNILAAVFIFGLIVLIHEFGHFLFARLCGIHVVEFAVGMGPAVAAATRGNTRYSLRAFPFGGFCAMAGEDSEAAEEGSFNSRPVLARLAVIAAGPGFNFVLAFLAAMVIVTQVGHDGTVVADVMEGYPAAEAGLLAGDRITGINGRKVSAHRDITLYLYTHPGKTVKLAYDRPAGGSFENGGAWEKRTVQLTPRYSEEYGSYMLGVVFKGYEPVKGIGGFLSASAYEVRYCVVSTFDSLGMLLRRQIRADEAVAGPVKIVSMVGETVGESREAGAFALVYVVANWILLLSASLGVMNLLPLPALDGGRLFFLLIELVRGKPVNRRAESMIHAVGMCVLMTLMVLILMNDLRTML